MEGSERPSIESLLQFSFGNEGQPILNLDGQNPTTSLQVLSIHAYWFMDDYRISVTKAGLISFHYQYVFA